MYRRPWTILDYGDRVYLRDADGNNVTEIQPQILTNAWRGTHADRLAIAALIVNAVNEAG